MGKKNFKDGTAYIVSSSHNDIAWFNTPYKTMDYRDAEIISPAIDIVEKQKNFKHTMECVLYLMEYLTRHPQQKELLEKLAKDRRFMWGATYSQPYEHMLNDEALIRQVYLGKRWFEKTFKGALANVAWSPDVPGRAMQMPQILKKSGVDYLSISRIDAGAFEWFSPDGSSVKGFSNGHYTPAANPIKTETTEEALQKVHEFMQSVVPHYEKYDLPLAYLFLSVEDYAKPYDFTKLTEEWPEEREEHVPKLKLASIEEFMDEISKGENFRTYVGDRPDEWAYIHGATHYEAIGYGRKASNCLPEAEMFLTINCLLEKDFSTYPTDLLEKAWKNALYIDHGLGGVNGEYTDKVFLNSMKYGLEIADGLRQASMQKIADQVSVQEDGIPIVVFNTKTHKRTASVRYLVDLERLGASYFKVVDEDGCDVSFQVVDEERAFSLTIEFITEIDSLGYKTFYVVPADAKNLWLEKTEKMKHWEEELKKWNGSRVVENQFYRVTFGNGGLDSIFDKSLNKELLDITDYKGFELFVMQSSGTGAGEFSAIQNATLDFSDSLKNYEAEWKMVEDCEIKTVMRVQSKISFCYAIQTISLYKTTKRIDVDIELQGFDGTIYKEFRLAVPTVFNHPQVAYDTVMGTIEVGKDEVQTPVCTETFATEYIVHYPTPCTQIHPREVQNWMSMTENNQTMLLSSDVALFDYVNPKNPSKTMLQPILLASRKSCHWLGNEYLQRGNHSFHFSFTSNEGDWRDQISNVQYENFVPVEVKDEKCLKHLPEALSFFSTNADNLVISAIKKCEDDENIVVRVYENFGQDSKLELNSYFDLPKFKQVNMIEYDMPQSDDIMSISKRAIETYKACK